VVLQVKSIALTTDWDLSVLQVSLKVAWQECQLFPTATHSNSIVLGHCIRDCLLLSRTMADNRKQNTKNLAALSFEGGFCTEAKFKKMAGMECL